MNGTFYVRGNAVDNNKWKKDGNVGGFKKMEDVNYPQVIPNIHGHKGYLHAEYMTNVTYHQRLVIQKMIHEADTKFGTPVIEDCSSKHAAVGLHLFSSYDPVAC